MTPKMELAAKIVWYYLLWMLEGVFLLQLIVFFKKNNEEVKHISTREWHGNIVDLAIV
jgi:hypothetical protein